LTASSSDIDMILEIAETLLTSVVPFRRPVRLLGIPLSSLNTEESGQEPQLALGWPVSLFLGLGTEDEVLKSIDHQENVLPMCSCTPMPSKSLMLRVTSVIRR
jgi:hypothetical protein